MAVCGDCDARDGERIHRRELSRTRVARVCGDLRLCGWVARSPTAPSGREWNGSHRARARLNWVSQGQRWGRCRVRRRAERVIRPAREKNRRRRVLVVTTCSPRPVRAVQRARLCAITCIASQAAFETARRHVVQPQLQVSWRSRPRHGGGGRPPVPGFPRPGR